MGLVARAGAQRSTVLVSGETSAGMEVIAPAIHATSPRRVDPLLTSVSFGSAELRANDIHLGDHATIRLFGPREGKGEGVAKEIRVARVGGAE